MALTTTHSTVGRRIRALEGELGSRLIERDPTGLRLTPAGQELFAVAERMEAELHGAQLSVMGQDQALSGPLRVSLVDFLMSSGIGSSERETMLRDGPPPHWVQSSAEASSGNVTVAIASEPISFVFRSFMSFWVNW